MPNVKLLKIVQGLFLAVLTVALSVGALLSASAFKWAGELPSIEGLDAFEFTTTSQIFARDGSQIGEILPYIGSDRATTNRIPVSLDEVSPAFLQAVVAYEDSEFFDHYGFDIPGLLRATYEEFLGSQERGGSTITTQVVKNELLTDIRSERSLERKAKELMLAVKLERRLTKAEILQRYINVVFWGGNVYGIHAAAQAYFDKEPIALTLAESLYLARLIPAPNVRHQDFEASRASIRQVLDRMVADGSISEAAAERAWLEQIEPKGWNVTYDGQGNVVTAEATGETPVVQSSVTSNLSDELTFAVRNWLTKRYGNERVYNNGGFRVYTTLDPQAQRAAMEASRSAEAPAGAQLAIVGLDPATGEVLALVGQRYGEDASTGDTFNRALDAQRQPGSSFKPIVYATAIEQAGFSQATVLDDNRTAFPQRGQPDYEPVNHDNTFTGLATIRKHLDSSRNIPAVKALEAATAEAVTSRASELGYVGVEPTPSLALGSYVATPIIHTSAIAAFANGGVHVEPHFIQRVEDVDGNVIWEAAPRETRVWSPETAYIMLDLMHGNVVDSGAFSRRAAIEGRWVAGKTGTTNDERDIWFVGVTPGMVAAVWIGYDDYTRIPKTMEASLTEAGDGAVNSSRQPAYVWRDFVTAALEGKTGILESFPVPEGVVFKNIDLTSGSISSAGVRAAFRTDTQLRNSPLSRELRITVAVDTRTDTRATASTPREFIEYRTVRANDISRYLNN